MLYSKSLIFQKFYDLYTFHFKFLIIHSNLQTSFSIFVKDTLRKQHEIRKLAQKISECQITCMSTYSSKITPLQN